MSLITLSHVTHVSQETVKKHLASLNSYERKVYEHGDLVKEYPSTEDEPFALTGTYEIPTNWPVFWNALDEVSVKDREIDTDNSSCIHDKYSVSEIISKAIQIYKNSGYYKKAKKVIDDKILAEKEEAESLRRNVPEITARYDVLEKELREVEATLFAYQKRMRDIKDSVARLDKEVSEKTLPKWLKNTVEAIRHITLADYNVSHKRWSEPARPLRLSDFTEAQRADGTADRDILAQMRELVNKGF